MTALQSVPSGSWKSGGVTATEPGAGGGEACGVGALQAASANPARASGASDFMGLGSKRAIRGVPPNHAKAPAASSDLLGQKKRADRLPDASDPTRHANLPGRDRGMMDDPD